MKKELNHKFYQRRKFICKRCGQVVTTVEGVFDKRTQFCGIVCRRRYWRHPIKRGPQ